MFGADETLSLNVNNDLVNYIMKNDNGEYTKMFCEQLYDLAMLANQPLPAEAMGRFVKRTNDIMRILTNK